MGRFETMMMVLLAIQAGLILYYAQSEPSNTGVSFNTGIPGLGNVSVNTPTPWSTVTGINLQDFSTVGFFFGFLGIAAGVYAAVMAIGSVLGFVTDFMVLAPVVIGLTSLITIIAQLAMALNNDLIEIFGVCSTTAGLCANTWITAVLVGPLFIYYFLVVIAYWRGRD